MTTEQSTKKVFHTKNDTNIVTRQQYTVRLGI